MTTPTTKGPTTAAGAGTGTGAVTVTGRRAPMDRRTVVRRGALLALGAVAMATTFYIYPVQQGGTAGRVGDVGGLAFQAGLFALLLTYWQTWATGTRRAARRLLAVQAVVLALATLWSALHLVLPASLQNHPVMMVLDACWPLSMLGMAVIGVVVAVVGRWRGILRVWPMLAEAWLPLSIAASLVLPTAVFDVVSPTLLIVGYGGLGMLLVTQPQLTLGAAHEGRADGAVRAAG